MKIGELRMMARAMAMRWRWPPESGHAALADHRVVAFRHPLDEFVRVASRAARMISSREASGLP